MEEQLPYTTLTVTLKITDHRIFYQSAIAVIMNFIGEKKDIDSRIINFTYVYGAEKDSEEP